MLSIDLEGRTPAIWGLGREGRRALQLMRAARPDVDIVVIEEGAGRRRAQEAVQEGIIARCLSPREAVSDQQINFLVKSPGVSLYRAEIQAMMQRGVEVTSLTSLWLQQKDRPRALGVTGTKGKSTTASLLCALLRASGGKAFLRGNVGRPLFDEEEPEVAGDWVVLELSSFQLADLQGELDGAVITNLSPEHLDWHGDLQRYWSDKLRVVDLSRGAVFANAGDVTLMEQLKKRRAGATQLFGPGTGVSFDERGLLLEGRLWLEQERMQLVGRHNLANAAAALALSLALGVSADQARDVVMAFQPLRHRLEVLGTARGRLFINDSLASTPQATLAALESFPGQRLHLLAGGFDRGLDLGDLADALKMREETCRLCAFGPMGRRLADTVAGPARYFSSLRDAFFAAVRESRPGEVVLLSPGAPSFDAFSDYAARGDYFSGLMQAWTADTGHGA